MLDPRIYRTGLGLVLLAVIVFAFSLNNQQAALGTNLAPDAFNGNNAFRTMNQLALQYPDRRPGSPGDDDIASVVAKTFEGDRFVTRTSTYPASTVDGTRTLETVTGTLPGLSSGSIVIVAPRDALGTPATAQLSGTAVLLELAQVLEGQTHTRTITLVSTSGSAGAAGTQALARSLSGPVDGVVVLGDLAGADTRQPVVVPWSDGQAVAPTGLRNTVSALVAGQTFIHSAGTSLAGQFARLAFPFATGAQAPLGSIYPTVMVSLGGERAPAAGEPIANEARITGMGRAMLQTVGALDAGPSVSAPTPYLLLDGKVVPGWAIRLLVLALIAPVAMVTVDAMARALRRGHALGRWFAWVLAGAIPFLLAAVVVLAGRPVGLIKIAPPGAVDSGVVPLSGGGIAVLAVAAVVLFAAFWLVRPLAIRLIGGEPRVWRPTSEGASPGAAAAVLILMVLLTLVVWVRNPFAAALMVPALHAWIWLVDPDLRLRPALAAVLLAIGLAAPALVLAYYAESLGLGPLGVAWNGILLVVGGHIGKLAVIEGSLCLGVAVSVFALAVRQARADRPERMPVTVRGPVTYAGPGSLGGTDSSLRHEPTGREAVRR